VNPKQIDTGARRAPIQDRARATVDAILEATAALLAERGYEGVNTNAVADRAGVKPPAVYRYFPNKFALYEALAHKLQGELDVRLDAALQDADSVPLAELINRIIDASDAFWQARPAFGALWYGEWSLRGSRPPALIFGERTVARFLAATRRFDRLDPFRQMATVAAAMHIGMAVINLAGAAPPEARPVVIAEAKRAVVAYLEAVLKN
jgi:AcrR family transcriptional regulator